jgi:D-sedoheptulose 7-phosphate isomerase
MKTDFFRELGIVFSGIRVSNAKGTSLSFAKALSEMTGMIGSCRRKGNKIILIGNGGSASIASHIATDLVKNCRIPAMAFNDASLITCLSNDLGYENVFSHPLEICARKGDILLAVSSSGKSANILSAVTAAGKKGCYVITLSGFSPDNPLRIKGKINFYVPSYSYGKVEIAHLAICHSIVDTMNSKDQ